MKLRLARKILKAVGTPDGKRYTDHQVGVAHRRYEKTESAKKTNEFYRDMMAELGVRGRFQVLRKKAPELALQVLMKNDERDW